jgi:chemotaxis protein methyltransferase CheR
MFRDPFMFKVIREKVLPVLATHPFIRIWHAGCATGEEVYSMAIMLDEANLLNKSLLYATDLNPSVIENIQKGIFPLKRNAAIFRKLYYFRREKRFFIFLYGTIWLG